jgi:hypothetical protein
VVTAPYFVATKLEAFKGRGRGDYSGSHDLEDLVAVIDGRDDIVDEILGAEEVRSYIAEEFRTLMGATAFVNSLEGHLLPDPGSQRRLPILRDRLTRICQP